MIARLAMSNDLSIQGAASVSTGNVAVAQVRPTATAAPPGQTMPTPTSSPIPTLVLNAALGLVVIEFRNAAGAVISSIPSQQQLAADRLWQDSGIGGPPPNDGATTIGEPVVPISQESGGVSRSAGSSSHVARIPDCRRGRSHTSGGKH
ncbi:MAG TPA: hypothetical protein VFE41_15130 [Acetobacteraceae bacterium]|jgi:hypothetical protein|nr:hypothetical protein [Acetobacteraceae bacterium]